MSGFYLVTRGITSHPLFKGKPERLAVWMWLMDNVAWQDTTHDVSGKTICVRRGSVCASERQIAIGCGVGRQVVRTALKRFQDEHMINQDLTHGKAVITLCNYEKHQQPEKSANPAITQHQPSTNPQKKQGNKETRKDTNVSLDARAAEIISRVASLHVATDFVAHRREIKKPLTERAAVAVANKIQGHPNPDAVLTDSIANGWQGVFPEKTGGQNDRTNRNSNAAPDRRQDRSDPAVDQILRLTGLSQASSDGGSGTGSDGEEDGSFRMGAGSWDVGARQADEGLDFGAPRLSVVGGAGRMSGMG